MENVDRVNRANGVNRVENDEGRFHTFVETTFRPAMKLVGTTGFEPATP
ncbi:hypothetical protein [Streptomyces sp. NPDC002962]